MTALRSRREVLRAGGALGVAAALSPLLAACGSDDKRLAFVNWQDYVDPAILRDFEQRTKGSIAYETYASNDELAELLQLAGVARRRGRKATTVDLIVPSDNLLRRLRTDGALRELDRDVVTDAMLDRLDPALRSLAADPGNRFSVPWATGTTGIGYDTTVFPEAPDWSVFLDDSHRGKLSLLDERREAFAAALFSLELDPNPTDQAAVDAAADRLVEMLANARLDSADYLDALADGELVAAQAFSTDLLQARERNDKLAFVIPPQGGTRWVDSLCIPTKAPNPDFAEEFVAFYLEPEVSAQNAAHVFVDTANVAAREFVPAELLDDPVVFPGDDELARLTFLADLGDDEQRITDAWNRVRDSA